TACGAGSSVAQQLLERSGERARIAWRHGRAEPAGLDERTDRVAGSRDHGKPRPQVVEHAGAVRELRLDVVEMGADTEVRVEQHVLSLVVRHPTIVEEDV